MLPPLKPIAIKERNSILFLERDMLDVLDGAFVLVDNATAQSLETLAGDVRRKHSVVEVLNWPDFHRMAA